MRKISALVSLFIIILLLTGCAGQYYTEDNEASIQTFKETLSLKKELKNSIQNNETPEYKGDDEIRQKLAEQIFSLDLERAKAAKVKEGNEPFFINKRSNVSIILVHGLTASPWETRELGERLAAEGYNVYGVLLAGHGTDRSELRKTKWQDWHSSLKNAYEAMSYISDKIYVIGVSSGGSLGIMLAEENKVDGIVCLACPVYLKNKNTRLIPLIKHFYWYQKRELTEEEKKYYYEYRPLESIEQLEKLISTYSFSLAEVNMPIMIIQNKGDPTVDPESAEFIFEKIRSPDKQKIYFEGNYHVLTRGEHKEEVFNLIKEFLEERK